LLTDIRAIIVPLLLATRFTFLSAVSARAEEKDAAYLAVACGILGKLSIGFDVPLAEIIQLLKVVQEFAQHRCP
jgi:hypothetical protein